MSIEDSLTVVVVTRDRCQRLRSCLTALLGLPDEPRIIVVARRTGTSGPDSGRGPVPAVCTGCALYRGSF